MPKRNTVLDFELDRRRRLCQPPPQRVVPFIRGQTPLRTALDLAVRRRDDFNQRANHLSLSAKATRIHALIQSENVERIEKSLRQPPSHRARRLVDPRNFQRNQRNQTQQVGDQKTKKKEEEEKDTKGHSGDKKEGHSNQKAQQKPGVVVERNTTTENEEQDQRTTSTTITISTSSQQPPPTAAQAEKIFVTPQQNTTRGSQTNQATTTLLPPTMSPSETNQASSAQPPCTKSPSKSFKKKSMTFTAVNAPKPPQSSPSSSAAQRQTAASGSASAGPSFQPGQQPNPTKKSETSKCDSTTGREVEPVIPTSTLATALPRTSAVPFRQRVDIMKHAPQYHYRLKKSYDPFDEHRHQKYCKNGTYKYYDDLLKHLKNETIDWVTEPLDLTSKKPMKTGFSKLPHSLQDDFKQAVTTQWNKVEVIEFMDNYKIYNTPNMKTFLWPEEGYDYDGAIKAFEDSSYGKTKRRQDFPWAFDTAGSICGKAKERYEAVVLESGLPRRVKPMASIESDPAGKSKLKSRKILQPSTAIAGNTETFDDVDDEDEEEHHSASRVRVPGSGVDHIKSEEREIVGINADQQVDDEVILLNASSSRKVPQRTGELRHLRKEQRQMLAREVQMQERVAERDKKIARLLEELARAKGTSTFIPPFRFSPDLSSGPEVNAGHAEMLQPFRDWANNVDTVTSEQIGNVNVESIPQTLLNSAASDTTTSAVTTSTTNRDKTSERKSKTPRTKTPARESSSLFLTVTPASKSGRLRGVSEISPSRPQQFTQVNAGAGSVTLAHPDDLNADAEMETGDHAADDSDGSFLDCLDAVVASRAGKSLFKQKTTKPKKSIGPFEQDSEDEQVASVQLSNSISKKVVARQSPVMATSSSSPSKRSKKQSKSNAKRRKQYDDDEEEIEDIESSLPSNRLVRSSPLSRNVPSSQTSCETPYEDSSDSAGSFSRSTPATSPTLASQTIAANEADTSSKRSSHRPQDNLVSDYDDYMVPPIEDYYEEHYDSPRTHYKKRLETASPRSRPYFEALAVAASPQSICAAYYEYGPIPPYRLAEPAADGSTHVFPPRASNASHARGQDILGVLGDVDATGNTVMSPARSTPGTEGSPTTSASKKDSKKKRKRSTVLPGPTSTSEKSPGGSAAASHDILTPSPPKKQKKNHASAASPSGVQDNGSSSTQSSSHGKSAASSPGMQKEIRKKQKKTNAASASSSVSSNTLIASAPTASTDLNLRRPADVEQIASLSSTQSKDKGKGRKEDTPPANSHAEGLAEKRKDKSAIDTSPIRTATPLRSSLPSQEEVFLAHIEASPIRTNTPPVNARTSLAPQEEEWKAHIEAFPLRTVTPPVNARTSLPPQEEEWKVLKKEKRSQKRLRLKQQKMMRSALTMIDANGLPTQGLKGLCAEIPNFTRELAMAMVTHGQLGG